MWLALCRGEDSALGGGDRESGAGERQVGVGSRLQAPTGRLVGGLPAGQGKGGAGGPPVTVVGAAGQP